MIGYVVTFLVGFGLGIAVVMALLVLPDSPDIEDREHRLMNEALGS